MRHSSGLTVRYNYTDERCLEDVRNTVGNALFREMDGAGADGPFTYPMRLPFRKRDP